jgi:hypothetical protein
MPSCSTPDQIVARKSVFKIMQSNSLVTHGVDMTVFKLFMFFFILLSPFFSNRQGVYCSLLDFLVPDFRGRPLFGRTWIRGRASCFEVVLRTQARMDRLEKRFKTVFDCLGCCCFNLLSHARTDDGQSKRETQDEKGKSLTKSMRRTMMMMLLFMTPNRNKLL